MRKAISFMLMFALCLSLCACGAISGDDKMGGAKEDPNAAKYQEANDMLNNGNYEQALKLFQELEKENYKDSAQKTKEAKYQFVLKTNDSENLTAYEYLQELVNAGYKDSKSVFEQLYAWKFEIAFSTKQGSTYHYKTVKATSQIFPFYNINFRITGGEPGASLHGQYEVLFSDGQKITKGFYDGNGTVLSVLLSATETPLGLTTFTLYDDYGNKLAQNSAYIE